MDLHFSRCICTHGLGQTVDCVVQQLLFHRHFVADPVPTYINSSVPSNKSHIHSKFCNQFDQMRKCITAAFRTSNVGNIHEVVLVIGGNFVSIRELYRITVPPCTHSIDSEDGTCAGSLSEKEHRQIARDVIMQQHLWDAVKKLPPRAKRLHVLLGVSGDAVLVGFKSLMPDMFSVPNKASANSRAIYMNDIKLNHGQNCTAGVETRLPEDLRWLACETVIEAPLH